MNPRFLLAAAFSGLVVLAVFHPSLLSQRGQSPFAEADLRNLSEPYKGVTNAAGSPKDLFPIHSSGVSTEPVRRAAEAFLKGLTPEQRKAAQFAIADSEWRKWANQHSYVRQGAGFKEMTGVQRDLAFSLLRSALSAKGLKITRDIMHLNETLAEMVNDFNAYGEWLYWITIMGEPSAKEPWGFQLDGHHVVINYFVMGDQVVMTPTFMGSEPVVAESGKYKDTRILDDEAARGAAMMRSLDEKQRARALVAGDKPANNNLLEAFKDNLVLDYAGVPAKDMTAAQRKQLLALVDLYVSNMDDGHARVKMDEVKRHLDATHFAWIGTYADDNAIFYYRIHSPVIIIEFDHQRPVALGGPRVPSRKHIHTVVRTPNGNDYGKDLLRQHYERHPHGG